MWIAIKKQKVKRGKEYVYVNPGEPIPEAETWPNVKLWSEKGYIRYVSSAPSKKTHVGEQTPEVEIRKIKPIEGFARKFKTTRRERKDEGD